MTEIVITPPSVTSVTATGSTSYTITATQPAAVTVTATSESHLPVTIGTANGLSLAIQTLSLGLASAGVTGALSGTDWSTFNAKAGLSLANVFTQSQTITGGGLVLGSYTPFAKVGIGGASTTMNFHGFEDWNVITPDTPNLGYSSFDSRTEITGSGNNSHFVGYQSRNIYTSSGNITSYWDDYNTGSVHNGAGTVALHRGLHISDIGGTGTVTTNYGIYIDSITRGATNHALYIAGGASYLGGGLSINTTNRDTWINVDGDFQLLNGKALYAFSAGSYSATDAKWGNFYQSSTLGTLFITAGKGSYASSVPDLHFCTYNGTTLSRVGTFQASTGNFGIGTISPAVLLDVSKLTAPTLRLSNMKVSAAFTPDEVMSTIEFYTGDDSGARVAASIAHISDFASNHGVVRGGLRFSVSSTGAVAEAMRITNGALVGIGGIPTGRFQVTGTTDIIQNRTLAHSTQTANIATWESSAAAVYVSISGTGVFFPRQTTTAAAPAYVKGGMYFDTTLNKLRIGGATAWETVTSV